MIKYQVRYALLLAIGLTVDVAQNNAGAGALPTRDAAAVLKKAGVKGGLIVHLNCGNGRETAGLRLNDRYIVQGLDVDDSNIRQARKNIRALGLYGKVTAYKYDGRRLPYADNLVNLIVCDGPADVPRKEILRVLAPRGVALIDGRKIVKARPQAIDEWTHFLHGPDNNAVARDRVVAAPRSIQWVAKPMWGRSHEELASMSAAVSAKGRVFFIVDEAPHVSIRFSGDWKLVARDAFNGTLLWKRDIPQWIDHLRHFRSGPVHLARRLVAVGEEVYVTLGLAAPVVALDAATGKTLRVYEGTEHTEEILVHNGVLYLVVGSSEVSRVGEGLFRRGEPAPTAFRHITAIEIDSKRQLWKKEFNDDDFLLPLTPAVAGKDLLYQSTAGVTCLDAGSSGEKWHTDRATPSKRMGFSAPTLVVTDKVVLCADRDVDKDSSPASGTLEWGVDGWNVKGFSRKGKSTLRAYSRKNGDELWSVPCSEGYNSPVDVFVVDGTAWVGSDYAGYDLETGEKVRDLNWKVGDVAMGHHRCYRNKATENYILTGRAGVEVVSLEKGWVGNNSWLRGTCQYGVMPSNGLLYAPPDACACVPKVKLPGFFAAAPLRGKGGIPFTDQPALEKGPAYGQIQNPKSKIQNRNSWPMYRHDGARSGAVTGDVPVKLTKLWSSEIGGRITQPVIVGDRTFVASTDRHTVYALDANDGGEVWSYTAGGRIDSSPTVYEGMVLFGSADGWVYALRASDGRLAWRFRAAPQEQQVSVFGQLEAIWPVHGSVLVQNDTLYVAAGRSTYIDGGIVLYRLDPHSGKEISRSIVSLIDPETDRQIGKEDRKLYGFDMEGTVTDILSGDGDSVFMKHFHFDRYGKRTEEEKPHLFSVTGFLIDEWFVRTYWLIATDVQAGWGGWARAADAAPSGRILSFDNDRVYGYGRPAIKGGRTGHRANQYRLFCEKRVPPAPRSKQVDSTGKRRRRGQPVEERTVWHNDRSLIVRAMVLASDKLVVAGPPDLGERDESELRFLNEPEALAGFRGEKGVRLQVVSAADGETLSEYDLDAMPVLDGLSAADGKLYIALKNGTVACYGSE